MSKSPLRYILILACVVFFGRPVHAQSSLQAAMHSEFDAKLAREANHLNGVLGYSIQDIKTGESFERNADLVFPTASSIKLAILLELMRQDQEGKLSLSEKHTIRHGELPMDDTDPILHMLGDGTATMSLRDIATFMVVLSDNGATNILINRVGMDNVNQEVERLGLTQTKLRRVMIDIQAAREGRENVSTPRELTTLLEKIHAGGVLDDAHTKQYFDLLGLPKDSFFNKALAPAVRIEDKPGELDRVRCDAGIIEIPGHPFSMTVMTTYLAGNEEGEQAIETIARLAYAYFNRLASFSPYGRDISEK